MGSAVSCHGTVAEVMIDIEAQNCRRKPEASRDEAESLGSFPLAAVRVVGKPTPVEDAATVQTMNPIDKSCECGEPGGRDEQIEWVVEELAGEGQQPDQRQHDADYGNNLSVDLSALGTNVVFVVLVQEIGNNSHHYCRADEFAKAQEDGEHARQEHDCGRCF